MSRNDRAQTPHEQTVFHEVIRRFNAAFYTWRDTSRRQNFIGAEAAAFDKLSLPLQTLKGPGEIVLQQIMTYSPQVFVGHQVIPTGIAGIGAGQGWQAQLMDNSQQEIV